MYNGFYGFHSQPFSDTGDSRALYPGEQFQEAKAVLSYSVLRNSGIVVITGEVGSGKSTLIKSFWAEAPDMLVIGVITNPVLLEDSFMHGLTMAFSPEYASADYAGLHINFTNFVHTKHREGRMVVLIVDEAQFLSEKTLERLRLLTNTETGSDVGIKLVLVGQPQLVNTLNQPGLEGIVQRIVGNAHIGPLSQEETRQYVSHQLTMAGANSEIFSEEAIDRIFENSQGIPRVINSLCDSALLYGYAEQSSRIEDKVISSVISDRDSTTGLSLPSEKNESSEIPDKQDSKSMGKQLPGDVKRMAKNLFGFEHEYKK